MLSTTFKNQIKLIKNSPNNKGNEVDVSGIESTINNKDYGPFLDDLYAVIYDVILTGKLTLKGMYDKVVNGKKYVYITIEGNDAKQVIEKLIATKRFVDNGNNSVYSEYRESKKGNDDSNTTFDPEDMSKQLWALSNASGLTANMVSGLKGLDSIAVVENKENKLNILLEEVNKMKKLFNYGK